MTSLLAGNSQALWREVPPCFALRRKKCTALGERGAVPPSNGVQITLPVQHVSALALHRSMKCAGTGETVHEVARRIAGGRPPCWIIDPRKSRRLGYWDALTTLCLLFTASVTPYEVALLPVAFDTLFILNRGMLTGGRTRRLGKAAPCANVLSSIPGSSSRRRHLPA